ncbi:DUF397 domain-containing protein [Micromonospora sp. NPDC048887]|uniref:DUF397 domain-containing protein n=1 Tax=unclassified Micromonospora TaxID=2617518 RepID=UPI00340A8C16
MQSLPPSGARWRESSGGDCVEAAGNLPGVVGGRDSKDPAGPALTFTPAACTRFVTSTRR